MLYPLTFHPILKERIWGGRNLEHLYHKPLPENTPVGESWEITDRMNDVGVIANGPLAGKDLRWLMEYHREELLGPISAPAGRFPILAKILDAQSDLSVQVHPPADAARAMGGEPKTEMWYVAQADPEAVLYAGLKSGTDQTVFEQKIREGTVAEQMHRIPVKEGDVLFLPSGRVHAVGAGIVIFELQQNSDTTYRVFDWNRLGQDGKPRALHIAESLACINFQDFEPDLIQTRYSRNPTMQVRYLVQDPLFTVDAYRVKRGLRYHLRSDTPLILALIKGRLTASFGDLDLSLKAGQFCLLPACLDRVTLHAQTRVEYLQVQPGINET